MKNRRIWALIFGLAILGLSAQGCSRSTMRGCDGKSKNRVDMGWM